MPAEVWRGAELLVIIPKGEVRIIQTATGQLIRIRGKRYGAGVRIEDDEDVGEENIPPEYEVDYDDIRVVGKDASAASMPPNDSRE